MLHQCVLPEVESVLQSMWSSAHVTIVEGPPGSGRTEAALHAAALASLDGLVIFIVGNASCIPLVEERFMTNFPKLLISRSLKDASTGIIIVSFLDLLSTIPSDFNVPWIIIDDADYLDDAIFALISPLGQRFVLTSCTSSLRLPYTRGFDFKDHYFNMTSIQGIKERSWIEPSVITLRTSYRLPQDTVDVLSPLSFSPKFRASSGYPSRSIDLPLMFSLHLEVDRAISLSSSGVSLIGCSLPSLSLSPRVDRSSIAIVKDFIDRFTTCEFKLVMFGQERIFDPSDLMIIVPNHAHFDAVRRCVPDGFLVCLSEDTLPSKPLVIVLDVDTSSGVNERSQFLYRSLTCHQIACFVVSRTRTIESPHLSFSIFPMRDRIFENNQFVFGLSLALSQADRHISFRDRS